MTYTMNQAERGKKMIIPCLQLNTKAWSVAQA